MSIWHAPQRPRIPAHPLTLSDLAIFAGGLLLAMMLGIAATGLIPL
ncbi:MAG TPA: hypothetical protein VHS81_07215 [Caulobacteraceae bacterium]|nr:hypothetical protein [Caulobacteraceae bacterium]